MERKICLDLHDLNADLGGGTDVVSGDNGDAIHKRNAGPYILAAICVCAWPGLVWLMYQSGGGAMDGFLLAGIIILVSGLLCIFMIGIVEAIAHIVSVLKNGLTRSVAKSQWPELYSSLSDLESSQSD